MHNHRHSRRTNFISKSALIIAAFIAVGAAADERAHGWQVYFSPHGGSEQAVVQALEKARASVYVQAYSFTNAAIAKALVEAHQRGVAVEVILDRSNRTAHYSAATFLINAGIPVSIDAAHEIAHNKVMIVDRTTVITGSYNFTRQAERSNAENLLVINDAELAAKYFSELAETSTALALNQPRREDGCAGTVRRRERQNQALNGSA